MTLDFGYPWWLSYGHLALAVPAGALLLLGYRRQWSRWLMLVLGALTLWSGIVFLLIHFGFDLNSQAPLPTQSFLRMSAVSTVALRSTPAAFRLRSRRC